MVYTNKRSEDGSRFGIRSGDITSYTGVEEQWSDDQWESIKVSDGVGLYTLKKQCGWSLDEPEGRFTDGVGWDGAEQGLRLWTTLAESLPDSVVRLVDFGTVPYAWTVTELAEENFADHVASGKATIDEVVGLLLSLQRINDVAGSDVVIAPTDILLVDGRWKFSGFGLLSRFGPRYLFDATDGVD